MTRATVVIGAGWGDEGKGLMTDYLSKPGGVVVRFNGGAQAGHTVVTPHGDRHVFSHFGSGSLASASTHLSRFFLVNPLVWQEERARLRAIDGNTDLSIDYRAPVTTHYDMLLNQFLESSRGGSRHGSCGAGIHETMLRHEHFPITYGDLIKGEPREKLGAILINWLPRRFKEEGVWPRGDWEDRFFNAALERAFISACRDMALNSNGLSDQHVDSTASFVFEGAQGLLLDQNHEFFPHVTHSSTGLTNVLKIAQENAIRELDVVYVTRAYATRHGAGPMPGETPDLSYPDPTNQPNPWQGTLRFGALNLDLLRAAIWKDIAQADDYPSIKVNAALAVTCMDQMKGDALMLKGEALVWLGGAIHRITTGQLLDWLEQHLGLPVRYVSEGPTRNDVTELATHAAHARSVCSTLP